MDFLIKIVYIIGLLFLISIIIEPSAHSHVYLNQPNGGQVLEAGTSYYIEWQIGVEHETLNWDLHYSTNGGDGPWEPIAIDLPVGNASAGTVHEYLWNVPYIDSDSVRVRITQDNSALDYQDISDSNFTITTEFSEQQFVFYLNSQEANNCFGTGSSAEGFCIAELSGDQTSLSLYIEHDVANAQSIEIYVGAECMTGVVSYTFSGTSSPISETWNLDSADVAGLLDGNLYLLITSDTHADGEIRGQFSQEMIKFAFELDESQADAGNGTGSFYNGLALAELDPINSALEVSISHDIPMSDVVSTHIYYGSEGTSGSQQYDFNSSVSPVNQTFAVSAADLIGLMGGSYYLNILTNEFPNGEIRGQIERTSRRWSLWLTEGESPDGDVRGFCIVELNYLMDSLHIYAEHDGSSVLAGHIHLGLIGEVGPDVFSFADLTSPIEETWAIDSLNIERLFKDSLYVNIHSGEYTDAELRGQIDQDPININFYMDESQANECIGTGSEAVGSGMVTVKPGSEETTFSIEHDVVDALEGHIHLGAECVSGAVQFTFDSATSVINDIWYLSRDRMINMMQGKLYADISSNAFTSGEIRGQLINVPYICGDGNGDSNVNLLDITYFINYLYKDGPIPIPLDSADVNGDDAVNLLDVTYLINYLYKDGPNPAC